MEWDWFSRDVITIDKRQPVRAGLGALENGRGKVVVCDDGHPYGILHARRLTDGGWHLETAIEKLAWPLPVLNGNDTVATATKKFIDSGAPFLPAQLPGNEIGCLEPGFLLHEGHHDGPQVRRAARDTPILRPDGTMIDALRGFAQSHVDALPVESEQGLDGVIHRHQTLPYITAADHGSGRQDLASNKERLLDDPLLSHLDAAPPTILLEASFEEAQEALREDPELVVLDGSKVAGVLSAVAMMRAAREDAERQTEMPTHFRQAKAPARRSRHAT